jgi:hypothetical protein
MVKQNLFQLLSSSHNITHSICRECRDAQRVSEFENSKLLMSLDNSVHELDPKIQLPMVIGS